MSFDKIAKNRCSEDQIDWPGIPIREESCQASRATDSFVLLARRKLEFPGFPLSIGHRAGPPPKNGLVVKTFWIKPLILLARDSEKWPNPRSRANFGKRWVRDSSRNTTVFHERIPEQASNTRDPAKYNLEDRLKFVVRSRDRGPDSAAPRPPLRVKNCVPRNLTAHN